MKKRREIILFIKIIFIIIFILQIRAYEDLTDDSTENIPIKYNGYIVELKNPPLVEKQKELEDVKIEKRTLSTQDYRIMSNYKSELESEHESALSDIRDKLNLREELASQSLIQNIINFFKKLFRITGNAVTDEEIIIPENEFYKVFNGISLDITDEQAQKIKESPYVKGVYPNLMVKAELMDSVPLINADDVWKLDEDGNDCAASGKDCLTGKGVKIAILDTGVDYTHPDLGGCLNPPLNNPNCFPRVKTTLIGNFQCNGPSDYRYSKCEDFDGGLNICNAGATNSYYCNNGNKAGDWIDICKNENTLGEYECYTKPDGSVTQRKVEISCPTGTRCAGAQCIKDDVDLSSCNKVVEGYNFVTCNKFDSNGCLAPKPETQNPMDDLGHGTHVAGIAAGSGDGGLKGVAPDAEIYAYKVLNNQGTGYFSWIIEGIERAVDPNQDGDFSDHVDIISMSLGADCEGHYNKYCGPDDPPSQAIDNAVSAGVVAVIAAGNSGQMGERTIASPGTARKAITIGATDKSDGLASFSSKGPVILENGFILNKPDLTAPGVGICSSYFFAYSLYWNIPPTCLDDNHMLMSGTSMATPMVAGAIALLKQKYPGWTPDEIKQVLKDTAKTLPYSQNEVGTGRLDILSAANLINPPYIAELNTYGEAKGIINIKGSAYGNNFQSYSLKYEKGINPTTWIELITSSNSVKNGILYSNFDTSLLDEDSSYLLKLTVQTNSGEISDIDYIISDNVYITSPEDAQILNSSSGIINILGTAIGTNFINYEMKIGKGSEWHTTGITLTSNGNIPVMDNILGTLSPSQIITDLGPGIYTLKLISFYNDGSFKQHNISIIFEDYHNGWPKYFPDYTTGHSVSVEDIDNDGFDEIISSISNNSNNETYAWHHDGSLVNGWPVISDSQIFSAIAIGDIDNDGFKEIVAGSLKGKIYAWHHDGSLVNGWPIQTLDYKGNNGRIFTSPSLGDIDGDGKLEILVGIGNFGLYGTSVLPASNSIFAWHSNGTQVNGWPVSVQDLKSQITYNGIGSTISLADLNNNGKSEVVVGVPFYEYVLNYNGTMFDGNNDGIPDWPKLICLKSDCGESAAGYAREAKTASIADMDNDGELEIIVYTDVHNNYDSSDGRTSSLIHVFKKDGSEITGFPLELPNNTKVAFVSGPSRPFPLSIGDINNDGYLEIITFAFTEQAEDPPGNLKNGYSQGDIIIINHDGSYYWPKGFKRLRDEQNLIYAGSAPVIADINNDGKSEILISGGWAYPYYTGTETRGRLFAWYPNGSDVFGFPKILPGPGHTNVFSMKDIDNDGNIEFVGGTNKYYQTSECSIYVIDLNQPYNSSRVEWGMFAHDVRHTGLYNSTLIPVSCVDNDNDNYDNCNTGQTGDDGKIADCNDNDNSKWRMLQGYTDNDNDGYGTGNLIDVCSGNSLPLGYSSVNGDCNDNDNNINPGEIEICKDSLDNNCNSLIDCQDSACPDGAFCDASNTKVCQSGNCIVVTTCIDNDGDKYIQGNINIINCGNVCGSSKNQACLGNSDCNDNNISINPGANEACNGIDDNCNLQTDEGFIDTDNDGLADCIDKCPKRYGLASDPNNIGGCPPPLNWSKFNNNLSTNFSLLIKYDNISLKLGIPGKGIINFLDNLNVGGIDFDSVKIERDYVDINSTLSPELNTSAKIILFNVSDTLLGDIKILKDGNLCNECSLIVYPNNTVIFNVTHFTRYSIGAESKSHLTGKVIYQVVGCGDEICNADETCSSCSQDCGSCSTNHPPGGGSGNNGGSGGSSGGAASIPKKCIENWSCGNWSECNNETKSRNCVDKNKCNTSVKKPENLVSCSIEIINDSKENPRVITEKYGSIIVYEILAGILIIIIIIIVVYKKLIHKSEVIELHNRV